MKFFVFLIFLLINNAEFLYQLNMNKYISCRTSWCERFSICIEPLITNDNRENIICTCPDGYLSEDCLFQMDDCRINQCLNNGKCVETIDGYSCNCTNGFIGKSCEFKIAPNECDKMQCKNNGTCVLFRNEPKCVCPAEFKGKSCEFASFVYPRN